MCKAETSAIAGTVFADTKLPLTVWFQAIWLLTNQKHGSSAMDIQRQTGVTYETAWTMLHKLRRAMVREDRTKLDGVIEVDETYVGGVVPGSRGRGALGKVIVAVAVERLGVGAKSKKVAYGRVRLERVKNVKKATLTDFVLDNCKAGAEIRTDHWVGYDDLGNVGFTHIQTSISSTGDPAHVHLPGVHLVASHLKRWLMGTHQGAVSVRQVDWYLDEFVFRWNRRTSGNRGLVFHRLIEQCLVTEPTLGVHIVGGGA
jgi:transposase-like protein